jgi:hypothetical protein
MREHNPMFNLDVRKRVSKTYKINSALGLHKIKTGKDSPLWKGNRDRSQIIRSRLYKIWISPILERDNFSCQECGKTNCRLEVHHIIPFRNILKKFLFEDNIDSIQEDDFFKLCENIENYHKDNYSIGITYCVDCHKRIDERRR